MKNIIFTLVAFAYLINGYSQTTYYISNTGSDSNSGLSSTQAWKTLNFASNKSYLPGDSILLERGSIFREGININSSGNKDSQITWGVYGKGNKPKILGSTRITSWTKVSGNIWRGNQAINTNPHNIDYGAEIFFETIFDTIPRWGLFKSYNTTFSNLTNEFDWSWNASTIFIYAPSDPNTVYTSVECPQQKYIVRLNGSSYITLDNLDLRYCASAGVYESYGNIGKNGLQVLNCAISNIGYKGSAKAFGLSVTSSNAYYAYNAIHDCGRRSISINVYSTTPVGTMQNVIIEHNHLYRGWHTTGVDCINSGDHLVRNITIRNNLIEGDPSVVLGGENDNSNGVFIANQTSGNGKIQSIFVYNNIIRFNHGKGIALENIDTAYIVFNTLYGFNSTLSNGQALIALSSPGNRNVYVENNILFNDGINSHNSSLNSVIIVNPESSTFLLDYNLYFNTDPNQDVFEFYQPGQYDDEYTMSDWSNYIIEKSPNDANSPQPSNPAFLNAPTDLRIQPKSPAKFAGDPVSFVFYDYSGNPRDPSHPSIGAYEYINPDSSQAYIISFIIPGQKSSEVNNSNHTVDIVMPYGTDLTHLKPTIVTCYAASVDPASGTYQDFSTPVTYTLTSGDNSKHISYTVRVTTGNQPPEPPPVARDTLHLSFAPNPASDQVEVTLIGEAPSDTFYARIFTLPGNIVYKSPVFTGEKKIVLPLYSSLKAGTYIIELIFNNSQSVADKLIISR